VVVAGFYTFGANGTDRYPPFSLKEEDYPAKFDVEYPEQLSKGLVLVKWLLGIPHYIVVGILHGGFGPRSGGLNAVMVIFASVALLFTGRYPDSIFYLVIGFYRWAFRVAAYFFLMRDEYPPFRLDP
jgi:hypothetical protein